MTATDGIDTHISQYEKFAAERILIEGSTQTSEVVMLAHTIELHILAPHLGAVTSQALPLACLVYEERFLPEKS